MDLLTAFIAALVALGASAISAWSARGDSLDLERLSTALEKLEPKSAAARSVDSAIEIIALRIHRRATQKFNIDRLGKVMIIFGLAVGFVLALASPGDGSLYDLLIEHPVMFWAYATCVVVALAGIAIVVLTALVRFLRS